MSGFRPWTEYVGYPAQQMRERARLFADDLQRRRSIRDFSDQPVACEVIDDCLRAAAAAPSGANRQPWHFVVVSNAAIKADWCSGESKGKSQTRFSNLVTASVTLGSGGSYVSKLQNTPVSTSYPGESTIVPSARRNGVSAIASSTGTGH